MPTYKEELTRAMSWLGQQPDTLFIGQNIIYGGNAMYSTFEGVPSEKKIELPVMENAQLGMSIGMALMGKIVVSIFPRMDFLLCATDMLVNHLDKGLYKGSGKVIIRVGVGSTKPMHPGLQHCGDYTEGLEKILQRVAITRLLHRLNIMPAYLGAYAGNYSSLLVEYGDNYGQ